MDKKKTRNCHRMRCLRRHSGQRGTCDHQRQSSAVDDARASHIYSNGVASVLSCPEEMCLMCLTYRVRPEEV